MYVLVAAIPVISIKWDDNLGAMVSPIPVPEIEISSSIPSMGLVRFTVTLWKFRHK